MLVEYVRDDQGNKVGTVVVDIYNDVLKMGWSMCSPKDKFNKDMGKKVAYGRLLKYSLLTPDYGIDPHEYRRFPTRMMPQLFNVVHSLYGRARTYYKQLNLPFRDFAF